MHSSIVFVRIVSAVYSLLQLLRSLFSPSRSDDPDLEQGEQTLNVASAEPAKTVSLTSPASARSSSSSFHCQDLGFTASSPPNLHHAVRPSGGVQSSSAPDQPQQDVAHMACLPSALATSCICSQNPSHFRSDVGSGQAWMPPISELCGPVARNMSEDFNSADLPIFSGVLRITNPDIPEPASPIVENSLAFTAPLQATPDIIHESFALPQSPCPSLLHSPTESIPAESGPSTPTPQQIELPDERCKLSAPVLMPLCTSLTKKRGYDKTLPLSKSTDSVVALALITSTPSEASSATMLNTPSTGNLTPPTEYAISSIGESADSDHAARGDGFSLLHHNDTATGSFMIAADHTIKHFEYEGTAASSFSNNDYPQTTNHPNFHAPELASSSVLSGDSPPAGEHISISLAEPVNMFVAEAASKLQGGSSQRTRPIPGLRPLLLPQTMITRAPRTPSPSCSRIPRPSLLQGPSAGRAFQSTPSSSSRVSRPRVSMSVSGKNTRGNMLTGTSVQQVVRPADDVSVRSLSVYSQESWPEDGSWSSLASTAGSEPGNMDVFQDVEVSPPLREYLSPSVYQPRGTPTPISRIPRKPPS